MVATTFAADTPLAVTGLTVKYGIAGNRLWWSFVMSGILTVVFYAKLWRRAGVMTDAEFAEIRDSGRPASGSWSPSGRRPSRRRRCARSTRARVRVGPGGAVSATADADADIGGGVLRWAVGCVVVYLGLFGIGGLVLGRVWQGAIALAVAAALSACLAAATETRWAPRGSEVRVV
jgi:hypothetical protein